MTSFISVRRKYTNSPFQPLYFKGGGFCISSEPLKEAIKERLVFPQLPCRFYEGCEDLLLFNADTGINILDGRRVEIGTKVEVIRAQEYGRAKHLRKINREYLEEKARAMAEAEHRVNKRKEEWWEQLSTEERRMVISPDWP